MKKNSNVKTELKKKNFIDKNAPLPLVPAWLLLPLWFVSLALPNLVYSGISFADTLHILKWTVTGVPIAMAVFLAGIRLAIYGPERVKIKFDIFSIIWAVILIYCALQPLWVNIKSPTAGILRDNKLVISGMGLEASHNSRERQRCNQYFLRRASKPRHEQS